MNIELQNFTKSDIFTPDTISQLMSSKLHNSGSLLEPSVGVGNLLKYINISQYHIIDVYELKKEYLDQINYDNINKYNLDFLKHPIHTHYDNIILNPPYIKVQDLHPEYRTFIKNSFPLINKGTIDIYYAFLLKCIDLLSDDGIMVSITPNSYLYNKSALKLRKYLFDNKLVKEIIDFGTIKVFPNISAYCCITIFTKQRNDFILYSNTETNTQHNIDVSKINTIDYNLFNTIHTINNDNKELDSNNIDILNNKTLKDICRISNGIATLRDKIYIHSHPLFNEPCWFPITNGKEMKYIIYPYDDGKIIEEEIFKFNNPNTYQYLLQHKDELAKRDKGNKTYAQWYAYGRTQAIKIIKNKSKVIYIPSFINPNNFVINIQSPTLYHSCLCIEPHNEEDIENIKQCIIDNIEFLKSTSTKRSGGWINVSSSNLYKIPFIY